MEWPEWRCTSGEHGRDGTSETVGKIGSSANDFFKPQKIIASPLLHHSVVKDYHEGMMPRSLDCS